MQKKNDHLKITVGVLILLAVLLQACNSSTIDVIDCNTKGPKLELDTKKDAACDQTIGEIVVKTIGGKGPFQFKINNGTFQTSNTFSSLSSGTYEIEVKDADNCTAKLSVNIGNRDGVTISVNTTSSGCGTEQGSITITAQNGTQPYVFKIGNGQFQSNNIFQNLARGNYSLVAKDANNCETTQTVSIKSGLTLTGDVQPIISGSCAISGCHNGSQSPNLTTKANIISNASSIKTVTGNKSMPKNGTLAQSQIDAIACWVDDGAPNN
jgi:major membrane immunogen (membrane-anchored lipoprotein)